VFVIPVKFLPILEKKLSRETNDNEAYITYEHGIFHGSVEDDDTYWCNDCA